MYIGCIRTLSASSWAESTTHRHPKYSECAKVFGYLCDRDMDIELKKLHHIDVRYVLSADRVPNRIYVRTNQRTHTLGRAHQPATHKKIYSQFGWLNHRDFVFDFLLIRHFGVFNRIPENGDKVVFIIELRNDNHSTQWIGVVIWISVHFFSQFRAQHIATHTHTERETYKPSTI